MHSSHANERATGGFFLIFLGGWECALDRGRPHGWMDRFDVHLEDKDAPCSVDERSIVVTNRNCSRSP